MDYIVEMKGICKSFPGVSALQDVSLQVRPGEIVGLVGENGAGKSTLMKILCGADVPDHGQILIDGRPVVLRSPAQAQRHGIFMVQQELSLIPTMTIAENVMLGRESVGLVGALKLRTNLARTQEALRTVGLDLNPRQLVADLDVATRQTVEIARNLAQKPRVLILDEPTTALSVSEIERLLGILQGLKEAGVGIIFISHKLDEVLQTADNVWVLRDGQNVDCVPAAGTTRRQLISMMVGRSVDEGALFREPSASAAEVLSVRDLSSAHHFREVSLTVHAGEVVGMFGLKGSGRTEVASAIFGALPLDGGKMLIDGAPAALRSPADAISHGVALLTEDRKVLGLFQDLAVKDNITMANLGAVCSPFGVISNKREREAGQRFSSVLSIKTPSVLQRVKFLSGGNQQKVLIARWLFRGSRMLILDEPTKGIDVGAKQEVYHLVDELARSGKGILMISSEIEEILAISDTVVVMRAGTVSAILPRSQADREIIMHYAAG